MMSDHPLQVQELYKDFTEIEKHLRVYNEEA